MTIAYLDCFSGISGDMFLGALLDAGLPQKELEKRLRSLPLKGYRLQIEKEMRNHISGTRFSVMLDPGDRVARHLKDIRNIIQAGDLSPTVKIKGIEIFEQIAEVEARIHNMPLEKVHFHEVGAVDSIVDIVGALVGIECLGIRSIHASPLPLGSGFIETAHGRIPVPAPATLEILKGLPIYDAGVQHEMVTPTGAALVKCLGSSFGPIPPLAVQAVGYGAGTRHLSDRPNLLRILIGKTAPGPSTETVVVLESNIDDMNPEWAGYLMEKLAAAGALDVVFFPVQMKKNRPGVQVQVMASPEKKQAIIDLLFRESTTLGVRFHYVQREILTRMADEVQSPWGNLRVKKVIKKDGDPFLQPEYRACREIAEKSNIPLKDIYNWVMGINKK